MPNQEPDFDAVPEKVFVDTFSIRIIDGMSYILLKSGKSTACFLMPLPAAKFLGKGLLKQVEEIEQKHSVKFDVRLPGEPLLSPWTTNPDKPEGGKSDPKK